MTTMLRTRSGVRIEDLPDEMWPRHEILNGRHYVSPVPTAAHQDVLHAVFMALHTALPDDQYKVRQGPGILRSDPDGTKEQYFVPDIVVLRGDVTPTGCGRGYAPEDVLLAVEVLSPSTRRVDEGIKCEVYEKTGIERYWTVDPATGEVHVMYDGAPHATIDDLARRRYA